MSRPKFLLILMTVGFFGFAFLLHAQEQLPVGTVMAIVLDHDIDSRYSKPGQRIVAHIAQEVPLDNKRVIPLESKVYGEITKVENGTGQAKLGVRFDRLELGKGELAIITQVRALASPLDVNSAATANIAGSNNNIPDAQTTVQIGGAVVYRGGGAVEDEMGMVVGKPIRGGVLAMIVNQPGSKCEGMPVSATPQAVWVFAGYACGVYGISRFQFENGTNAKTGEILFTRVNKKDWRQTDIKLSAGTAFLLSIVEQPRH
jgi:hypothetical protein